MVIIHLCIEAPEVAERIASAVRLAGFEPRDIGDPRGHPALIIADGPLPGGQSQAPLVLVADSAGPEAQAALDAGAADLIDARTPLPLTARRLRRLVDHRLARGEGEQFLRRVTHDLKSPLLNMRQMARFLVEDEPDLSPGGKRFATRIAKNAERMTRVVDRLGRLVDLSNTSLRILRCDPVAAVREAVRPVGLPLIVHGEIPEVWVDLARFGQLVLEVAQNAEQAGARTLTLTAHRREPMLELVLTDDGAGLPEDQLERVLAPMVRLGRDEQRTGLGLAIA
ncbi:MAG: HAMP domain-containing histidine kinase, partial [Myxococcales bacterium]|nr:HAMP domain-containing histidine kinase [Myxococcales bacterium]